MSISLYQLEADIDAMMSSLEEDLIEFARVKFPPLRQSVAKKMIRTARKEGVVGPIHRGGISANVPDIPANHQMVKDLKRVTPPEEHKNLPRVGVNVARRNTMEGQRFPGMDDADRRHIAAHEIGHARNHSIGPVKSAHRQWLLKYKKRDEIGSHRLRLNEERKANAEAIRRLREAGATDKEIVGYRHDALRGFRHARQDAVRAHVLEQRKGLPPKQLYGPTTRAEARAALSDRRARIRGNEHNGR